MTIARIWIALLCASSTVFAQTPAQRLPEFEVATVKPAAEMTLEQKAAFVPQMGPVYFNFIRITILELVMIA